MRGCVSQWLNCRILYNLPMVLKFFFLSKKPKAEGGMDGQYPSTKYRDTITSIKCFHKILTPTPFFDKCN